MLETTLKLDARIKYNHQPNTPYQYEYLNLQIQALGGMYMDRMDISLELRALRTGHSMQ